MGSDGHTSQSHLAMTFFDNASSCILILIPICIIKQEHAGHDGNNTVRSDSSGDPPPVPSFAHVNFGQFNQRHLERSLAHKLFNDLKTRLVQGLFCVGFPISNDMRNLG